MLASFFKFTFLDTFPIDYQWSTDVTSAPQLLSLAINLYYFEEPKMYTKNPLCDTTMILCVYSLYCLFFYNNR